MEMPNRPDQHITEDESFRIFRGKIPKHWILRDVRENDYGIDCYIEIVTNKHQVTGELISIQLKGKKEVKWNKEGKLAVSNVKISTTNYWNRFPVPVFICLIDTTKEEAFFLPVKKYIKQNFFEYAKQDQFTYYFDKDFDMGRENMQLFISSYLREKHIDDFKESIITFVSHYEKYNEFVLENTGRDCFLGVGMGRVLFLKHFYQNLKFLIDFLGMEWELESIKEYHKKSQRFGDDYYLYEQEVDEIVTKLEEKLIPLLLKIRDVITISEKEYWLTMDIDMYNIMNNIGDDGAMSFSYYD